MVFADESSVVLLMLMCQGNKLVMMVVDVGKDFRVVDVKFHCSSCLSSDSTAAI